jgi:hypothetical protein
MRIRANGKIIGNAQLSLSTLVIWTRYTAAAAQTRAPYGLSSLCTRDEAYWLTKANLVFDIVMEL